MNSSIQTNRRLQYLFIPLLLAGFAVPALEGGPARDTETIILNNVRQVLCTEENADIRGKLELKFGHQKQANGETMFVPVNIRLVEGFSGACPNNGECLVGFGKSPTRRRYVANTTGFLRCTRNFNDNGVKAGWGAFFLVLTAQSHNANPGNEVRFRLAYTISYKFHNNNVTNFKLTTQFGKFGKIFCSEFRCPEPQPENR
jgi:hypothetical protein